MIRHALVSGRIRPGRVYSAPVLAGELGVSNSPVREAMLALVDEGLMEAVPNKGFRAVSLTDRDMGEIVELRRLLEVPAAGLAAERGLGARLGELTEIVDEIERSARDGDLAANLAADRRFHLGILEATGNRRLVRTVARLRDQTRLYNLEKLAATGDLIPSAAEHRPILAAIAAGDRALAEELMRRHLGHLTTDWAKPSEAAG